MQEVQGMGGKGVSIMTTIVVTLAEQSDVLS